MLNADELITIGKVLRPHGLSGFVKVFPTTDSPDRFRFLKTIRLRLNDNRIELFELERFQKQNRILLLKFKETGSRDAAEKLRDAEILIPRNECLALENDEYYIFDLIGSKVETMAGDYVGVIKDVLEYPAQDVYLVKNGKKEALIPAVAQIVKKVDIQAGRVVIDMIEGLAPA